MTNLNNGEELQPETTATLPVALPLSFAFIELIEYCISRDNWEEVYQVFTMINILLRYVGTKQDYELLDRVEKMLKERSHGFVFHNSKITMEQPNINGPMYEIRNNENINLCSDGNNKE